MTVIAMFNGVEIARSDGTIIVEGNHYFPREDVREECLVESSRRSICPWKGRASYWVRGFVSAAAGLRCVAGCRAPAW